MEKKLTLQDISERLALRENTSKKDAEAFSRAFFEVIEQGLTEDKFVKIKGFGTFKLVAVGERESIDVNTGERIQINGHSKVSFTPDTMLKDLVNRPFSHFQTVILNDETDLEEMERIDQAEKDTDIPVTYEEEPVPATEEDETKEGDTDNECNEDTKYEETDTPLEAESIPQSIKEETPLPVNTEECPEILSEETKKEIGQSGQTSESELQEQERHSEPSEGTIPPASPTLVPAEDKRRTPNWWKIAALTLLTLILMCLSYFVGYFRILCPCELMPDMFKETALQPSPARPQIKVSQNKTILSHNDSTKNSTADTLAAKQATQNTTATAETNTGKTTINTDKAITSPQKKPKREATVQTYKGKYRIVGTRQSYTISRGETIRTIAEYVYGSKGYAPYIIQYNHLKNPDNVAAGTVILLPELERNTP